MAVVIRMKMIGRKNAPSFRISVADSRAPRDGRTLDNLGLYDPRSKVAEKQLSLDVDRARAWLQRGALPSETVRSIFKKLGVIQGEWPVRKRRERAGRKKKTQARATKRASQSARTEAKAARYKARVATRRAAKKAAAAAAPAAE
jgi:small subunit ribosomal protein S16